MVVIITLLSILVVGIFSRIPTLSTQRDHFSSLPLLNNLIKVILPAIFFSMIFGLRDAVGVDYPVYREIYEHDFNSSFTLTFQRTPVEWLFTLICWTLKYWHLPYYWMFIVMGFIPMAFYMLFIKAYPKQSLWCTYFLFATGTLFWYFNIMRQGIAFFILLYSCKYIINHQFFKYLFFVFIAAGFHSSSLLFIIFFITFRKEYKMNLKFALLLYLLSWILSTFVLESFFSRFEGALLIGTSYGKYANNISTWTMGGGMGLGVLSLHFVDIGIILLSRIIYDRLRDIRLDVYYNIFFIGAILSNIAGSNMLLSRIPFCMVSIRFFLAGYLTWYLQKNWFSYNWMTKITGIIILLFSSTYFLGNILYTDYKFFLP